MSFCITYIIWTSFSKNVFEAKRGGYTSIVARRLSIPTFGAILLACSGWLAVLIAVGSEYVRFCTCESQTDAGLYNHHCHTNTSLAWKDRLPYNESADMYNEVCIEPGKASNTNAGGWAPDGSLRIQIIVGYAFAVFGVLWATFVIPETLRPTHAQKTLGQYLKKNSHLFFQPYGNLGPLLKSTPLLKVLITVLALQWCAGLAGVTSAPLLRLRYGITSADTAAPLFVLCAITIPWLCCIPMFITRYGDYTAWICWSIFSCLTTLLMFFNPAHVGMTIIWISSISLGPIATCFGSIAGAFLPKLVPNDITLVMQSGRNSMYQTLRMFVPLCYYGIFLACYPGNVDRWGMTESVLPYPFDGLPLLVVAFFQIAMLIVLLKNRHLNPTKKLEERRGLEDFYKSPYGTSEMYRLQGSGSHHALKPTETIIPN